MPPTTSTSALADLWGLLAELLSFPSPALEEQVGAGTVQATIEHMAAHLEWDAEEPLHLLHDADGAGLASEFIRLFDVPDGPTTPLYTGVYSRRRRDAMEELLRFYRHFGLTLSGDDHDLPDYVPTVLEFLRFLALTEAAADSSESRAAAESATNDVIERHVAPWAGHTLRRLEGRSPHAFYLGLIRLVDGLCKQQRA